MNKNCLTAERIETYLNSAKNSVIRSEIDAHLTECPVCKSIMEAAKLGQPKTLVKSIHEVNNLLSQEKPSSIKAGQIWRLKYNAETDKRVIAVITESGKKTINVVLAYLNPISEFIDVKDAVVKSNESPLDIEFLAECWNQKQITLKELDNYIGEVSPKAFSRIEKAIMEVQKANPVVETFRNRQIDKFKGIGELISITSNIKESEIVIQKAAGVIKKSFNFFEITVEDFLETIAANEINALAAGTFPIENLKKLLQSKDKSFTLRQIKGMPDISISRKDKKNFNLVITPKKGKKFTCNSVNGQVLLEDGFPFDMNNFKNLSITLVDE